MDIINLFNEFGLLAKARNQNKDIWDEVLNNSNYVPVAYTNMNVDFLFEVHNGKKEITIKDLSSIIYWDNKPVAIWPLFLFFENDKISFHFLDNMLLPPILISTLNNSIKKKLIKKLINLTLKFSESIKQTKWNSMELFDNTLGLGYWHTISMELGYKSHLNYEQYIDLSLELDEIKSNFRKSDKLNINSGLKKWNNGVLDKPNISIWKQFMDLHEKVSGRKTRSDRSWEIHYEDIINKNSFLVYLLDQNGSMVGAGFFNSTIDEGLYAVAAFRRDLPNHPPLGHVVQFLAIKEFKKRNVKWYKLGPRPYLKTFPKSSEKEISIAEFKNGFSTHMITRPIIEYNLKT